MTEAEIAWIAGIFEGEGCISISAREHYVCSPVLTIVMTDKDVLDRLLALVPGSRLSERHRKEKQQHWKRIWSWQVGTGNAIALMEQLYPWLGKRRRARWDELYGEYRAYYDQAHPLRVCANPECGRTFTLSKRNQTWCTASCGTRAPKKRAKERVRDRSKYATDPSYRERKIRNAKSRYDRLTPEQKATINAKARARYHARRARAQLALDVH